MSARNFIDTSILVYANDSSDPEKQLTDKRLILECMRNETAAISVQVIGELWVTVTQKINGPLDYDTARREIELFSLMHLENLTWPICSNALVIQKRCTLSYWDALIVSAAHSAGCTTINTEDLQHGQRLLDIEIVNPFLLTNPNPVQV